MVTVFTDGILMVLEMEMKGSEDKGKYISFVYRMI
jgi:hypothetical protein